MPTLGTAIPIHAQNDQVLSEAAGALDILFELGLPDTRNAKWVFAVANGEMQPPMFSENSWGGNESSGGNGWLLSEQSNGEVTVVLSQSAVRRGKKGNSDEESGESQQIHIKPADLAKDARAFLDRLKKTANATKSGGYEDDYRARQSRTMCGPAMLFLAHLQRHGMSDVVKEALPHLIKVAGSPDAAMDEAISALADGELKALAKTWERDGNAAAYAAGIDALSARFSPRWKKQGAAMLLAKLLREPHASENLSAEGKAAAALLLKMTPSQYSQLPSDRMWLLPKVEGEEGGQAMGFNRHSWRGMSMGSRGGGAGGKLPEDAAAFFADSRKAALGLAQLVEDRRILRLPRENGSMYGGYSYDDDSSDGAVEAIYNALERPMELGEAAVELLNGVVPDDIRHRLSGAGARPIAEEWAKSIVKLSDEALAWQYLSEANSASEQGFGSALAFLVTKGGAESLAKLEAVFADPAVWSGNPDSILTIAEKFMARRGGDAAGLTQKMKDALVASMKQQAEERARYSSGNDSYQKMMKQQETALLKRFDSMGKPVKLSDLLNDVVNASAEDAPGQVMALGSVVAKTPRAEAAEAIFTAAARAKDAGVKMMIVGLLSEHDQSGSAPKAEVKLPSEPARKALQQLLADQAVIGAEGGEYYGGQSVADATAAILVRWYGDSPTFMEAYGKLQNLGMVVMKSWWMANAKALAEGKAVPVSIDLDATLGDAELTALLKELGALSAPECRKALNAKPLNQQVGLVKHLLKPETEWPAGLKGAHLSIADVQVQKVDGFDPQKWKGRVLDDATCRELRAFIETFGQAGGGVMVQAHSGGVLSGFNLRVMKRQNPMPTKQLESMGITFKAGQIPADYLVMESISSNNRFLAGAFKPAWRNPSQGDAWRKEQEKNPANAEQNPKENERGRRSDPEGYAKALKSFFDLTPESRTEMYSLNWAVFPIGEPKVDADGNESPDEDDEQ